MTHLRHIKLKELKGLKEVTLKGLERVNVVSGPNNSGKSTVLEAVAKNHFNIGIEMTQETADKIVRLGLHNTGWGQNQNLDSQYAQRVHAALKRQNVWFEDEFKRLHDFVDWSFAGNYPQPSGNLLSVFLNLFPNKAASVLVPAKRKLETSKNVNAFDFIYPDGTGLLNYLFSAKNQNESSPVRKKFDLITEAFYEISAGFEFDVYVEPQNHAFTTALAVTLRAHSDRPERKVSIFMKLSG